MTKKSKKKAAKFGTRKFDSGGVTSIPLNFSSDTSKPKRPEDNPPSCPVGVESINTDRKKVKKKGKGNNNRCSIVDDPDNNTRCVYPFDLWCLISKYVAPEDIVVFSCLCKDAYLATCTVQFWITLYRKHVREYGALPVRLSPEFVNVKPGLRARVVRALFQCYSLFKDRVRQATPVSGHVEELLYGTCWLYWYRQVFSVKRGSKFWTYYFKFQLKDKRRSEVKSHLKLNSEESMCILQISCTGFMQLPSITGLVLTNIGVSVGRDMRFHQVKMTFHPAKERNLYRKVEGLSLTLDPVLDVKVLNWWHPSYPHPLEIL